jgi:hypothetical protein
MVGSSMEWSAGVMRTTPDSTRDGTQTTMTSPAANAR